MPRVLWTPIAESDLDDILYYIARVARSPSTGERIYFELRDRVIEQAVNVLPGHRHPAAPAGWQYSIDPCATDDPRATSGSQIVPRWAPRRAQWRRRHE